MKTFDLVVDAQNDFIRKTGKLPVPEAEALIELIEAHLAHTTSDGVLFTFDTHRPEVYAASEEAKQFPPHCEEDSDGWLLAVDPRVCRVPTYYLHKGVFDMWQEPGLDVIPFDKPKFATDRDTFFNDLREMGVTKIRVIGVASDYCVKWAIDGLLARGFEVEVIAELTKGITRNIEQVIAEDFAGQPVHVGTGLNV